MAEDRERGLSTRVAKPIRRALRVIPTAWFLAPTGKAESKLRRAHLKNGPALVVGLAPDAVPPVGLDSNWSLLTANSSQVRASAWGMGSPDVTLIRQLADRQDKPHALILWEQLAGLSTGHVFSVGTAEYGERLATTARMHRYSFREITMLTWQERLRIAYSVSGVLALYKDRFQGPSNGIFAAVYALFLGAPAVVMSGFSLSTGAHRYSFGNLELAPREHVLGDRRLLTALAKRNAPLFTCDHELAEQTGLPIWDEAAMRRYTGAAQ